MCWTVASERFDARSVDADTTVGARIIPTAVVEQRTSHVAGVVTAACGILAAGAIRIAPAMVQLVRRGAVFRAIANRAYAGVVSNTVHANAAVLARVVPAVVERQGAASAAGDRARLLSCHTMCVRPPICGESRVDTVIQVLSKVGACMVSKCGHPMNIVVAAILVLTAVRLTGRTFVLQRASAGERGHAPSVGTCAAVLAREVPAAIIFAGTAGVAGDRTCLRCREARSVCAVALSCHL